MQAENLVLDNSGQRQVVKQLSEDFPYVCITVLAQALVVEAVPKINLSRNGSLTPG